MNAPVNDNNVNTHLIHLLATRRACRLTQRHIGTIQHSEILLLDQSAVRPAPDLSQTRQRGDERLDTENEEVDWDHGVLFNRDQVSASVFIIRVVGWVVPRSRAPIAQRLNGAW